MSDISGRGEASQGDLYNDRRAPGGGGHKTGDTRARGWQDQQQKDMGKVAGWDPGERDE